VALLWFGASKERGIISNKTHEVTPQSTLTAVMKAGNLSEQKLDKMTVAQFQTDGRKSLVYKTSAAAVQKRVIEVRETSELGGVDNLVVANDSGHFVCIQ